MTEPVVYRVWDANGRLIYVGATNNLEKRLNTHRTQSWWTDLIDHVDTEPHASMAEAFAAEAAAITAEMPTFNATRTGAGCRAPRLTEDDKRACREWGARNPNRVGYLPVAVRRFASGL